jgi:uncharacterized membrane protein YfcA
MSVYLPIAEISVNILILLGMGAGVGMMSGIFGVGGGFLMTPLLIFLGVPAPVAVGTEANQIVASSVSGALAHFRRGNIDLKMGFMLLIGGIIGSTFGVSLFKFLSQLGQIDVVIRLAYVVFLGIIGALMAYESVKSIWRTRTAGCTSTAGSTACRSRCGSAARSSTSAPCCRSRSARWSGCWRRSWASAAASSWSRP